MVDRKNCILRRLLTLIISDTMKSAAPKDRWLNQPNENLRFAKVKRHLQTGRSSHIMYCVNDHRTCINHQQDESCVEMSTSAAE